MQEDKTGTTTVGETVSERLAAQLGPNSFQLKQMNENAIQRLLATGLFPNKQTVIQAALVALFERLVQKPAQTLAQPEGAVATAPPSSPEQEAAARQE